MLFDTHVHLQDSQFSCDLARVIQRARDVGVDAFGIIGDDIATSRAAVALALRTQGACAVIGVHPHHAKSFTSEQLAEIEALAAGPRVVAIGEIGIDYHYPDTDAAAQERCFLAQAALARRLDLPIAIHCRDAYPELIALIQRESCIPRRGIVHCFGGTPDEAQTLSGMGYYIGIDAPITYPASLMLREVAARIGLARIVAETDAPYLPPQSRRGRRNEPAYMVQTVQALAYIAGCDYLEAARVTRRNGLEAYGIAEEMLSSQLYSSRDHEIVIDIAALAQAQHGSNLGAREIGELAATKLADWLGSNVASNEIILSINQSNAASYSDAFHAFTRALRGRSGRVWLSMRDPSLFVSAKVLAMIEQSTGYLWGVRIDASQIALNDLPQVQAALAPFIQTCRKAAPEVILELPLAGDELCAPVDAVRRLGKSLRIPWRLTNKRGFGHTIDSQSD